MTSPDSGKAGRISESGNWERSDISRLRKGKMPSEAVFLYMTTVSPCDITVIFEIDIQPAFGLIFNI